MRRVARDFTGRMMRRPAASVVLQLRADDASIYMPISLRVCHHVDFFNGTALSPPN
jgi:hypothetical protein